MRKSVVDKALVKRRANCDMEPEAPDVAGEEVVCEVVAEVWAKTVEGIGHAALDRRAPAFRWS